MEHDLFNLDIQYIYLLENTVSFLQHDRDKVKKVQGLYQRFDLSNFS